MGRDFPIPLVLGRFRSSVGRSRSGPAVLGRNATGPTRGTAAALAPALTLADGCQYRFSTNGAQPVDCSAKSRRSAAERCYRTSQSVKRPNLIAKFGQTRSITYQRVRLGSSSSCNLDNLPAYYASAMCSSSSRYAFPALLYPVRAHPPRQFSSHSRHPLLFISACLLPRRFRRAYERRQPTTGEPFALNPAPPPQPSNEGLPPFCGFVLLLTIRSSS